MGNCLCLWLYGDTKAEFIEDVRPGPSGLKVVYISGIGDDPAVSHELGVNLSSLIYNHSARHESQVQVVANKSSLFHTSRDQLNEVKKIITDSFEENSWPDAQEQIGLAIIAHSYGAKVLSEALDEVLRSENDGSERCKYLKARMIIFTLGGVMRIKKNRAWKVTNFRFESDYKSYIASWAFTDGDFDEDVEYLKEKDNSTICCSSSFCLPWCCRPQMLHCMDDYLKSGTVRTKILEIIKFGVIVTRF